MTELAYGAALLTLALAAPIDGERDERPADADACRALLASDDFRDQCWGAYWVGECGYEELAPELLALIAAENDRAPEGRARLKRAALDAAIRIGADVPAELLVERDEADMRTEYAVLFARDPAANREALHRLRGAFPPKDPAHWMVTAALASVRDRELVVPLMRALEPTLVVTVRDAGDTTEGYYGGGGGGGSWFKSHYDGPPIATYHFDLDAENEGARALVRGPMAVGWYRTEGQRSGRKRRSLHESGHAELGLRALAAVLGGTPDELPLSHRERVVLDWVDGPTYVRAVREVRATLATDHAQLLDVLVHAEMLTEEEAGRLPFRCRIVVQDYREGTDGAEPEPLPEVPDETRGRQT